MAAAAAAFSGMMGGEGSGKRVGVERRAGSGSLGVVAFDVEGLAASLYVCVCMGVCGPFLPSVCVCVCAFVCALLYVAVPQKESGWGVVGVCGVVAWKGAGYGPWAMVYAS